MGTTSSAQTVVERAQSAGMTERGRALLEVPDRDARPGASEAATPHGRIHVVTDEPIEIVEPSGARGRLCAEISRRRWLPPAVLLGLAVAYLLLRPR